MASRQFNQPSRPSWSIRNTFPSASEVSRPTPEPPLGPLIEVLRTDAGGTNSLHGSNLQVANCRYVTSYSWLDRKTPTILVPGEPPMWTPMKVHRRLKEDSGIFYRDKNGARYPDHPMEPAVQAILTEDPTYPTASIDVVACSSTMLNLLKFVQGRPSSFRTVVHSVGNTVFLVRRERSPKEQILGIHGYGHTFPEAYTSWSTNVKGSVSHQRILEYDFAGFKILMRSEADGYLPSQHSLVADEDRLGKPPNTATGDVLSDLSKVSISPTAPTGTKTLSLETGGSKVPQDALLDMKTRSSKKTDNHENLVEEMLPKLWVSQVPSYVVAYHECGVFNDIRIQNVRDRVLDWEKKHIADLHQLARFLGKIVETARSRKGPFELYRNETGNVEMREPAEKLSDALPPSLVAVWTREDSDTGSNDKRGTDSSIEVVEVGARHNHSYENADDEDDEFEGDFTACSADDCGYCGKCSY